MLTLWLFLPLGAIFVFIGLAVHVFKWYSMISGYNTMSKEQKANVDVEGLSKAVGIFCYVNGGLFLLTGILSALGVEVSVFIPFGVLLVSTPYFVSSVRKYDKNTETQKAAKGLNWTMLITLVLVAVLFFFATRHKHQCRRLRYPDYGPLRRNLHLGIHRVSKSRRHSPQD